MAWDYDRVGWIRDFQVGGAREIITSNSETGR